MIGKAIRLERIIDRNSGKTVIIPMDHGVTVGPIEGLTDMRTTISKMVSGGANAILMHKGLVRAGHRGAGRDVGLIIHLSAGTSLSPDPNTKELVCTVEEAIKLGADAVSIHINLGAEKDHEMLRQFGVVSERCTKVVEGCPIPVVIAGGPKMNSDEDIFRMVEGALAAGAAGASIGRNAFQHARPDKMVQALSKMVHEKASVQAALEILKG
ncbi:MAG: fructose-bisphosphate aldolase [Planctomycetes bacterium]|nr:fructose-bisphosphate aldolase [Planctomycetota bacterium]